MHLILGDMVTIRLLRIGMNLGLHGEDQKIPGEDQEILGRIINSVIAQRVMEKEKHQVQAHGKEPVPRRLEQFTLPNGREDMAQLLRRSLKKQSHLIGRSTW